MLTFYVTPLSLAGQWTTSAQAEASISAFLEAIGYLEPALARTARIFFDCAIESRCLKLAEPLTQTLNNSIENRDLARLWYLFSRNRAEACNDVNHEIKISYGAFTCTGGASSDEAKSKSLWIGLEHPELPTNSEILVEEPEDSYTVKFLSGARSTRDNLPQYEPNPKHKSKRYTRTGGHNVSPMSLTDVDAQLVLLTALRSGNCLYAQDERDARSYKFVKTHVDREVYHGFEIDRSEVPAKIRASFA